MVNSGDSIDITLDYTINGIPLEEYGVDEIEFVIGSLRYTLSEGDFTIDEVTHKYKLFIPQADSLQLNGDVSYQVRFRKGAEVASTSSRIVYIGETQSNEVI